jgi:ketosteroid isomerase-like protein
VVSARRYDHDYLRREEGGESGGSAVRKRRVPGERAAPLAQSRNACLFYCRDRPDVTFCHHPAKIEISMMNSDKYLDMASRFFKAYNDIDTDAMSMLVADDLHWEHHNRFKGSGSERLFQSIRDISKTVPGRYFTDVTRWAINGDVLYLEHQWHGTPTTDFAPMGWKAGTPVTLDCCAVIKFRDEIIVEWSDYA